MIVVNSVPFLSQKAMTSTKSTKTCSSAAQSEMSNWQRGLPTNPRSFAVSPRSFISFMVHDVHIQQFLCPQLSCCLV